MKAWQVTEPKTMQLLQSKVERGEGEVKVKLSKVVLTDTELDVYLGRLGNLPLIPAHCALGYVSESDENSVFKLGERVLVSPYTIVDSTIDGDIAPMVEIMGVHNDGLLRDFVVVPEKNVCLLPEGARDEDCLFAENIGLGINAFEILDCGKGDHVLILGAGVMGRILAQLAMYYQLVPIVIDDDAKRLKVVEELGVYYTVNAASDDAERKLIEMTGGKMAEAAIFENGRCGLSPDLALKYTSNGGKIALVGSSRGEKGSTLDVDLILDKQLAVRGVSNGADELFTAINLIALKAIKFDGTVRNELSFDDVAVFFNAWEKRMPQIDQTIVVVA